MLLEEYFVETVVKELQLELLSLSQEMDIPVRVLSDIMISEAKPCNYSMWPKTWLTKRRLDNFFSKLDEEYLKAFKVTSPLQVSEIIDEWQGLKRLRVDKLKRLFERDKGFKLTSVYYRSRSLKDMFVLVYYKDMRGVTLRDMIRTTLKRIKEAKIDFTPRVVWKWNSFGTDKNVRVAQGYSGRVLEVGESDDIDT